MVRIRSRAAVFRGAHLALNPLPEVGDPAVDPIFPCQSTPISPAGLPNKDVLIATLISQRSSGVALWNISGQ